MLAQFNLTGKQLEQVTPLLADYASSTGKDMPSAAQDLGKALLGNAKALKNVGISYKSTGDSTKDFANITALMQKKVGGFAETEGKTAAGTAAILKNQFGEMQELVGSKLVPILQKLAGKVLGLVQGFQEGTGAGGKLREAFDKIKKTFEENRPQLEKLGRAIGQIAEIIVTKVLPVAVRFQTEVITKMIDGIGLLVDAFEGIKGVVQGVVEAIIPPFLAVFDTLIQGAASAFGWVPGIGDKLEDAAKEFSTFRDAANTALDGVRKEITPTIRLLGLATLEEQLVRLERRFTNIGGVQVPINAPSVQVPTSRFGGAQAGLRAAGGGGLVINGGITVNGSNDPDAGTTVSRKLTNLAFQMGY